jgi:hypothetical protein
MEIVKPNKKISIYIFLLTTVFLIILKWIFSYLYFDDDITLRIINDTSDTAYYPIINAFSNFDFSPSYSDNIKDLDLISFPLLSLLINSIFFKIFGSYSFIILEFICVNLFLIIFYKIFLKFNFPIYFALTSAVFLFVVPSLLHELSFLNLEAFNLLILNLDHFYSLRFPRPIITNLFFFSFVLLTINFYIDNKDYVKKLSFLTILLGITLNAFFYLFFIEFFFLIIIFILKFKNNLFKIIFINLKQIFYCFLILLFFVIIFQIQIFYSEPDYIQRLGVFKIDLKQKTILFDYYFNFILGKNFIFLFLLNTLYYILLKSNISKILYFLFISSVISPFFFFLFFSKGVDYYHFFGWIVVCGFLFPFISSLVLIKDKILPFFNDRSVNFYSISLIILMISYLNLTNAIKYKNDFEQIKYERNNLNELVIFIKKNKYFKNKNSKIFNLNEKLSIWFLLENYKNFSIIPISFWNPKTDDILENELISTVRFLKLDENDFYDLIKNEFRSWRYQNPFVRKFFGRKYMANSLVTFKNDTSDFTDLEKKYIESNNLISTHQVIIPKSETQRLLKKFKNFKKEINPELVVIDSKSLVNSSKFKNDEYCLIFKNNRFLIYINKTIKEKCD